MPPQIPHIPLAVGANLAPVAAHLSATVATTSPGHAPVQPEPQAQAQPQPEVAQTAAAMPCDAAVSAVGTAAPPPARRCAPRPYRPPSGVPDAAPPAAPPSHALDASTSTAMSSSDDVTAPWRAANAALSAEIQALVAEVEALKEERACTVCLHAPRTTLLLPCAHLCVWVRVAGMRGDAGRATALPGVPRAADGHADGVHVLNKPRERSAARRPPRRTLHIDPVIDGVSQRGAQHTTWLSAPRRRTAAAPGSPPARRRARAASGARRAPRRRLGSGRSSS